MVSQETLVELRQVLLRNKFERYATIEERDEFLEALVLKAVLIDVTAEISASRDPNDDRFLELAFEVRADAIVSGDADLLVLHPFRGIPILKPQDFLTFTDDWERQRSSGS